MPSSIWLALGVVFAIVARICVTVMTSSSVSRRRDRGETCHLAVFLGSGELDTICNTHYLHAQTALMSRWSQQRGPVTCVCTGVFALFPEDVSGK
jgi:hypothetical protein